MDKPGFVETNLEWRQLLKRRDGCVDHEDDCGRWAAQGACSGEPLTQGMPSFMARCPRTCGGCPPVNGTAQVEATVRCKSPIAHANCHHTRRRHPAYLPSAQLARTLFCSGWQCLVVSFSRRERRAAVFGTVFSRRYGLCTVSLSCR